MGNVWATLSPLGGIRTPDPTDRNRVFYPTELRAEVLPKCCPVVYQFLLLRFLV